jgi:hypothetical protein
MSDIFAAVEQLFNNIKARSKERAFLFIGYRSAVAISYGGQVLKARSQERAFFMRIYRGFCGFF